jgi:hypothetical protein
MSTEIVTSRQGTDLGDGAPIGDQRVDSRHRTVLQVAKLETAHGDELCILRNVSAGGLRADVYSELAVGEPVRFELKTGRSVAGRVVWTDGSAIGVEFDRKVPILAYLAHQAIEELGRRIRPPRVHIGEPGLLRVADREFPVEIYDASQAGMRVRTDRVLFEGGACQIVADGLGERGATVRWCHDGQVGLQFKQPLQFRDFAAWRTRRKTAERLQ